MPAFAGFFFVQYDGSFYTWTVTPDNGTERINKG